MIPSFDSRILFFKWVVNNQHLPEDPEQLLRGFGGRDGEDPLEA